ncbi:MAG TPA: peptide deformylase [Actinomycetota bacterium]
MALLTVRTLGDPILRTKAAPVATFDDELRALAEDMHETMAAAPGVGLAAPQVGRPIRLLVFDSGEEGERGTIVNPVITAFSEETQEAEEGCLSIPGAYYPVVRALRVHVQGLDVEGAPLERDAEGLLARILQHEIDHLDGILFIDRLAPEVRKEAMRALRDQDFGQDFGMKAAPPNRRL